MEMGNTGKRELKKIYIYVIKDTLPVKEGQEFIIE